MSGRFFVHTFGCQMNVHDSDRMKDVLVAHGWTAAPSVAAADLVVFNTCSVRETRASLMPWSSWAPRRA